MGVKGFKDFRQVIWFSYPHKNQKLGLFIDQTNHNISAA